MGRRLNLATPTVINTELVPFDESFYIEPEGQLEQWFYENDSSYMPDRSVTPLILYPRLSCFDKDTKTEYHPAFYTTQWYVNKYDSTQNKYVETVITNTTDSASAEFVIVGNNLRVKKNVSYAHAITIRCVATYIDPRDSGITYTVQESVTLVTNRDATVVFPEVVITSPSARSFNPLTDYETVNNVETQKSQFQFTAGIANDADASWYGTVTFKWYAVKDGLEVLADTMPWYVSGQNTATLTVDAMYGESINVVLRAADTNNHLYPSKAYANIYWRMPDVDITVSSQNGGAVRSDTKYMGFNTIVNIKGRVIPDAHRKEHIAFNWKTRKNTLTTEVNEAWGDNVVIKASKLRNVRASAQSTLASTLVYPYAYVKSAYEQVFDDDGVTPITASDGTTLIYGRKI